MSELLSSSLYRMREVSDVKVSQSCLTLCDPIDYTVHEILQARILEWEAYPFSRGSSQPRDWTQGLNPGLPHCRQILYQLNHKGSPRILECVAYPFSRGSSWPRNWAEVSCIASGFFTNWATREEVNVPQYQICYQFISNDISYNL